MDNNRPTPSRIPVRFVDDDPPQNMQATTPRNDEETGGGGDDPLTPEELGRESSYEDATEMQRRVDRGTEQDTERGRGQADDRDTAGSIVEGETPENREERDTTRRAGSTGERRSEQQPRRPPAETSGGRFDPARPPKPNASGSLLSGQAELLAAQAELNLVEAELKKVAAERQEFHDLLARRQADFDNYRKRVERERTETYQRAVGEVLRQLLPVIDNLHRAVEAEASVEASESEEFRHFLHGVVLIEKQLNGVLDSLGLKAVETVGHPFDPHVHEAIATEQSDEHPADTVIQEVARGYRLGDKLLRPALVKVATR
ncbi:MAG: nucleotide exchange factor GrpE [Pyrinomonadaceae bacterium]